MHARLRYISDLMEAQEMIILGIMASGRHKVKRELMNKGLKRK